LFYLNGAALDALRHFLRVLFYLEASDPMIGIWLATSPTAQDPLARILGLYGALVATIGLAWAIRRDIQDKPALSVRARVPVSDQLGFEVIADIVVFEIVNVGKRTIHLRDVGGRYIDGRPFALGQFISSAAPAPVAFPVKLEPTERVLVRTRLLSKPRAVRALSAWDTLNKEYRAESSEVSEVVRRTLQFRKQPSQLSLIERLRPSLPVWLLRADLPSEDF
jgi:hypothetical protein